MADEKEFESLDALFKKTFDQLPEQANTNGWDVPSERVWQHVQNTIQPPKNGWTLRTWSMVTALGAVLLLGLYLMVSGLGQASVATPKPLAPAAPTASNESNMQPEKTTPPAVSSPQIVVLPTAPVVSKPLLRGKLKKQSRVTPPVTLAPPTAVPTVGREARLLPGSPDQTPPNTTELREREARKRAIWHAQAPHLPLSADQPEVPLLPKWMKQGE